MADAVVLENLRKTFGPKVAVDNVSLRVPAGTVCGFIGPNGAGKTTTIRMIMSIIFPDSGSISVLGKSSAVESKDRIGYLPEERGVYRKMKVGAFLAYMAKLKGMDSAAAASKAKAWLERVGLRDSARKKCEELSKGMQQKVQFIAAVIHEPDLVILDEVFSGLDPVNRRLMRELIDEQHKAGRTIIFSTHAMFEAEQLCDSVFMIDRGRKMLDAPVHDILARYDPRSIFVEPVDRADGAAVLRSIPGVRSLLVPEGPGAASRPIEANLTDDADATGVIASIAAAMPVRRLEVKRATLEDVFIDVVRSAGGTAPRPEDLRADGGSNRQSWEASHV